MRQFTTEEIDTIWQQSANMKPEDAPTLVEAMGASQPAVLSYLLAIGDDILTTEERQVTFYIGSLIWSVVNNLEPEKIVEITAEQLIEQEEKNFKMLEYLAGEPDAEFMPTVAKIMDNYNQRNLLQYIIERMMEEPDKGMELYDNHVGMMVIYLKSVIDCLDLTIR